MYISDFQGVQCFFTIRVSFRDFHNLYYRVFNGLPDLGKSMCSLTSRLIDWEYESRDQETLLKLMKRLEHWDVLFYCADHYEAYKSLIPPHRFFPEKARTYGIERNNRQQGHWLLRFKQNPLHLRVP